VTETQIRRDPATVAAIALSAALFAARFVLLRTHSFNPDELEHLHGAWSIAKGLLPYRDYFEHHTPWLHALLALFVPWFRPELSFENAAACIFAARVLMIVFSGLALALTFRLGRLLGLGRGAFWAVALSSLMALFADVTLQVRPDVPALVCLLAGWVAMAKTGDSYSRASMLLAGLAHGAAVMFTQKALFALPAVGVLLLLDASRATPPWKRLVDRIAFFGAGLALPLALTAAFFATGGALTEFFDQNFGLNARWKARVGPGPVLWAMLHDNGPILLLAAVGAVRGLGRLRAEPARALLPLLALGWLAGAAIIPIAYAQYFLPLMPVVALLAAQALVETRDALNRRARAAGDWAVAAVLAVLGLAAAPAVWRDAHPSPDKVATFLARLQEVLSRTAPEESVMDGFSGLGVFRPHASYYFFPHHEIQAVLDDRRILDLATELREGSESPALLVMDLALQDFLRDKNLAFLKDNYEPFGDGPLWKPRDLRLDGPVLRGHLEIGSGPGDALLGEVWFPTEQDGPVDYRCIRGKSATVRIPLADPKDGRLRVRARAEQEAAITVLLNSVVLGRCEIRAQWQDCELAVGRSTLHAGINLLRVRVIGEATGPPSPIRRQRGQVALDWIELGPN